MADSKSQIDKLGERLKSDQGNETDLRKLDEYRRSFTTAFDHVEQRIQRGIQRSVSGRRAKSTTSIVEKLRRESVRLSQVQDIAGCRLIVSNIVEQDRTVPKLAALFEKANVIDRREKPSNGYRAVHVVVLCEGKNVEIQVRTELQQLWAELCEKLSDLLDPAIKYGGGTEEVKNILVALTAATIAIESQEVGLADPLYQESPFGPKLFDERLIKQQHLKIELEKHLIFLRYREIMENLSKLKVSDDISG